MKKLLVVLAVLLIPHSVFATAQISDQIVYNGEKHSLFSEPLERYFGEKHRRPDELFVFKCTACWRGYVASWEIKENHLYLTKIVEGTCGADAKEIEIDRIFPGQKAPVKAVWYSGMLRIPQGKLLRYEHMGYGSTFEKELLLTIQDGKLIDEKMIDNTLLERLPVPLPPELK